MDRVFPPCRVCGLPAKILNQRHPGYQQPETFCIYSCAACDLQFSWPSIEDPGVYEHIYANAAGLSGYDFYASIADRIGNVPEPLNWLAAQSPGYWFVREAMTHQLQHGRPLLEVGSGLGYLTFALRKAGYDARGIDVSEKAVEDACRRFGPHYQAMDVHGLATAEPESVGLLIMMEVIEHLKDPLAMLKSLHHLLAKGGTALITTPNKSSHGMDAYWQTDNPPVHQWWFSESAMRRLAAQSGFNFRFWDFSSYNGVTRKPARSDLAPAKPPMLDASGAPAKGRKPSALKAVREFLVPGYKSFRQRTRQRRALMKTGLERSALIGIVLTKP